MKNGKTRFQFNLGPISRTLGEGGDHLGFASLPVHELIMALLGARNREEFISWLWHDTFKALFMWELKRNGAPGWFHIPGGADQANLGPRFDQFANIMGINPRLARFHHHYSSNLLDERKVVSNEFNALHLGEEARFLQLSFACQPTAHTFPLRQCVVEAFLRAMNQVVAKGIQALNLPFHQVLYRFERHSGSLSVDQIAARYDLNIENGTLRVVHWVPSHEFEATHLCVNLTDAPPRRGEPNTLALIELLTVYRDELTLITASPLFLGDIDTVIEDVQGLMDDLLPDILEQAGIQTKHSKTATSDLVKLVLDQMIEIRAVAEDANEPCTIVYQGNPRQVNRKPIHRLIQRPYQLMAMEDRQEHTCAVCGSPITSEAVGGYKGTPQLRHIFSSRFTDFEYVGFEGGVCPLCLIYANYANRQLMRGSLAFLAPSTALGTPVRSELVEQPRFDNVNRFDPTQSLPKTAVTLQEMVLLTHISRRIIDQIIPFKVADDEDMKVEEVQIVKQSKRKTTTTSVGIHFPYSGAYLIYHQAAVSSLYRDALIDPPSTSPDLWQHVQLRVYPFLLEISPAFTLLISVKNTASHFHGRHTLLKSHPTQVFLSPKTSFNVLIDDAVQETVNRELVETIRLLKQLTDIRGLNKTEREEVIKALLAGHNPVEAVYLAVSARKGEEFRFSQAMRFWNREVVSAEEIAEVQWQKFTRLSDRLQTLAQAHPTLLSLL